MPHRPDDHVTLDPEDWEEFRALAHTMIDDTLDYLRDFARASSLAANAARGTYLVR